MIETSNSFKPDFLGIGAQRAATTWLYRCLDKHPDLYLSRTKEIHFFDENFNRGWQWYEGHFTGATPGAMLGEITPNYLDVPDAAERIALSIPGIKMIAILREPVSRARSSFELLRHRFPNQSFEEACVRGSYLVELGLYAKHLARFYDRFDRSQILVLLYDDIVEDSNNALSKVCQFLGVPAMDLADGVAQNTNSVVFPRTQRFLSGLGMGSMVEIAKQGWVGDQFRSLAQRIKDRERNTHQKTELKKLFVSDISQLEQLISRDLSHWK